MARKRDKEYKMDKSSAIGLMGMYLMLVDPKRAKGVTAALEGMEECRVLAILEILRGVVSTTSGHAATLDNKHGWSFLSNIVGIGVRGALTEKRITATFLEATE